MKQLLSFLIVILFLAGCDNGGPDVEPTPDPEINIRDGRVFEIAGNSVMQVEVFATGTIETPINFTYETSGGTAEPEVDFVSASGSGTIDDANRTVVIFIDIIDDDVNEVEENFNITLTSAENATIKDGDAVGVIQDNEAPNRFDSEGYWTPETFYGYDPVWTLEFDNTTSLDPAEFNFEIGDGCPNLCGWGNQELQWYTDSVDNLFFQDGKMVIRATRQGAGGFKSARVTTKGKKEFMFGRIDVRAKLPFGQGIWPAIWMLGQNINQVSWPACGEIDIMEMVGHEPKKIHGTAP